MGLGVRIACFMVGIMSMPATWAVAGTGGAPLVRGTLIGGMLVDAVTDMVVLKNGNVAVCGYTESRLDGVPAGGWLEVPQDGSDGFVAVLTPDLLTIKYFTYVGGTQNDIATGIAEDHLGGIVVVGETTSPDFPATTGAFGRLYSSGWDGFIICLTPALTSYTRSSYITGNADEMVRDVAVDKYGSIYVCGATTSASGFPVVSGYDRLHNGGKDGFVLKTSPGSLALAFCTYYGGSSDDDFMAIAVSDDGMVALTGWTSSADLYIYPEPPSSPWIPVEESPYDATYNGGVTDAMLAVFSADGSSMNSSTFFGGALEDVGTAIDFNERGQIVVFGKTYSLNLPVLQAGQASNAGQADAFMSVFDTKGRALLRSTYFGGVGSETITRVAEMNADIYNVIGTTNSRDIGAKGAGAIVKVTGTHDMFLAQLSTSGYSYFTTIGWSQTEEPRALAMDAKGDVYLGGSTVSPSITWDRGTKLRTGAAGVSDAFIVKWAFGVLDLSTPHTGDKACLGSNVSIGWTFTDLGWPELFSIEISADGAMWDTIARNVSGRTYNWKVPEDLNADIPYYVRVSSVRDHASRTEGTISILPGIRITVQPRPVALCAGEPLVLSVEAVGDNMKYQWRRNGYNISGQTSNILNIASPTTFDAGRYDLAVISACGLVTSDIVTVTVGAIARILEQPTDAKVEEYQATTFKVMADGVSQYQWQHDGVDIPNATSAQHRINTVRMSDAGAYRCVAFSNCSSDTSQIAMLQVDPATSVAGDEASTVEPPRIGPVPASDYLMITGLHDAPAVIVNSFGQVVKNVSGSDGVVAIADMPAGTYVLVQGRTSLRFVVWR